MSSWKIMWLIVAVIAIPAMMFVSFKHILKADASTKCDASDAYGSHDPGQIAAQCPDHKQKFTVIRWGANMGYFDYKCSCE